MALAVVIALNAYGVPILDVLAYSAYWLMVIALPGRFLWRKLMERHEFLNPRQQHYRTGLEDWVCGAMIGYALEIPAYVVARAAGEPRLYLLLPGILLAAWIWNISSRKAIQEHPASRFSLGIGPALVLAGVAIYLTAWIAVNIYATHPLNSGRLVDPDEAFHLALLGELRHHFPATYPYLEYPGRLTYQWFVHAHMAASTWVTGLSPDVIYRRFDPMVLSVLSILGVAVLAVRVSGRAASGPVAAALLVLVGSFDVTGSLIGNAMPEERFLLGLVIVHSPTQTFASALAVPVLLLCLELIRPGVRTSWWSWACVALLMGALAGAKVTFVPMIACGFLAVCVISALLERRRNMPSVIGFCLAVTVIVLSGWILYGGDSQSLGFHPMQTARFFMEGLGLKGGGVWGQLVVSLALLTMWLVSGAGIVGLLVNTSTRRDLRTWWLLGAISAGYGATFLLGHGGNSQLYFGRSASLLVAVASSWGLLALYPATVGRRVSVRALAIALGAGVVLFIARLFTETWRSPILTRGHMEQSAVLRLWVNLPVLMLLLLIAFLAHIVLRDVSGGRASISLRSVIVFLLGLGLARSYAFLGSHAEEGQAAGPDSLFGLDGRRAAEWLLEHSDPSDRVITNAHCGPILPSADPCDARHFWMSALSERRFVLEGWAYTARSGEWTNAYFGDAKTKAQNDRVFTEPSEADLKEFAREHRARWIFVDDRFPADVAGLEHLDSVRVEYEDGPYLVLGIK